MLINYTVSGYKVFSSKADFTMLGDKKFKNKNFVFEIDNKEILKSSIIYGPNNTGKSTFIESIALLKEIVDKEIVDKNILNDEAIYNFSLPEKIINYSIEFMFDSLTFSYDLSFKYNFGIVEEKLLINNKLIFDRNGYSKFPTDTFKDYNDKLIVCFMPNDYKEYTDIFKKFFDSLLIMTNDNTDIFINEVYDYLKNSSKKERERFNKIIKLADISLDSVELFDYQNEPKSLNLISRYNINNKKYAYFTFFSDSNGTKKFMKYLVRILNVLKNGGIVIIDEIDSSLHTLLTKSIINVFNNTSNHKAQLITTSHDLLLLDAKYLFRKDQIWFTYKDDKDVYFYCLNDFKSNSDEGIRNNLLKSYLKGMFGALPHPDIESEFYGKDTNTKD